jgi:hypothetical protein
MLRWRGLCDQRGEGSRTWPAGGIPMSVTFADFRFEPQPEAAAVIEQAVEKAVRLSRWLERFEQQLLSRTGTRLLDWLETIGVALSIGELERLGFVPLPGPADDPPRMYHPAAQLPRVIPDQSTDGATVAWRVESVVDFGLAQGWNDRSQWVGGPESAVRRVPVPISDLGLQAPAGTAGGRVELWAVEQHGTTSWTPQASRTLDVSRQQYWRERLLLRDRSSREPKDAWQQLNSLVTELVDEVGSGWGADLFFAAERRYWQSRNQAARLQAMRQASVGLGWANHDHHTYRSSRSDFHRLVAVMERLGLECRERFYAGHQAGWGAQVLEHPTAGVVVFADVDLAPDELSDDFAHHGLPRSDQMGTVGLWCELHGQAIFEAGMHHLECQFSFEEARRQLMQLGAASMQPFSNFDYLRQSFTEPEIWPVAPQRLQRAVESGWINRQQAEQFSGRGAAGSHLEVLERNQGYKGFNQSGISHIIRETDPRRLADSSASVDL